MSRLTTTILIILASMVLLAGLMIVYAKKSDGPIEILSGGPFTTGEVADIPDDWSFLREEMTIELQTMNPPGSRVMWLVVVDNQPYVMSNYMNTSVGKIWKKWPGRVAEDNRAIIRVHGQLYELALNRVFTGPQIEAVLDRFNEKYRTRLTPEDVVLENTWLFELLAR